MIRLAEIHTYELWIGFGSSLRGGRRLVSRGPLRPGESGGSSVTVRDKNGPENSNSFQVSNKRLFVL
jgi:hypothetical protein